MSDTMQGSKRNVLIFPAGAENAIEVYRAIRCSIHIHALGASSRDDISDLVYDQPVLPLPEMSDPEFLDRLVALVEEHRIDVVFPTHDSAALFLAQHADRIPALIPNADLETNLVCRHKRRTYELFRDRPFCPTLYQGSEADLPFPLFAKPDVGQGGKGARVVEDRAALERAAAEPGMLLLEYLPGREFTIDCFTDREGRLLFAGTRERVEVRMGISFRSRAVETTPEIRAIAERINASMKLRGLWFFQLREAQDGTLKLLEVSTRAAGTGGFFRHVGVNLPLLTIFDLLGHTVDIRPHGYEVEMFRSTTNYFRYSFRYSRVYVDLDDTLILNGCVNADLVRFLYAALARGKQLFLITKHAKQPAETLMAHRLSPSLFDEIIHVPEDALKSEYIEPGDSIFIDNWYRERREVVDALGIPVFDVDTIDSLMHSL